MFAENTVGLRLLVFTQLSLKTEPSESKFWYENRVWREIATHGHSRSLILQSITGRQGVAYRHIILLVICWPYL